jgi:hypothetical protein
MKLDRTYDDKDYKETIMVINLCYEERQREIEHVKKLNKAGSKKDKGKEKEFSKPESSSQKENRKIPYDKRQKKA